MLGLIHEGDDGRSVGRELVRKIGCFASAVQDLLAAVEHRLPVPFSLGLLDLDDQRLDVGNTVSHLPGCEVLTLLQQVRNLL